MRRIAFTVVGLLLLTMMATAYVSSSRPTEAELSAAQMGLVQANLDLTAEPVEYRSLESVVWKYQLSGDRDTHYESVVAGDLLVIASIDGAHFTGLRAIDSRTGQELWGDSFDHGELTGLTPIGERLIVSSRSYKNPGHASLRSIDLRSGMEHWSQTADAILAPYTPIVSGDVIIQPITGGEESGAALWMIDTSSGEGQSFIGSRLAERPPMFGSFNPPQWSFPIVRNSVSIFYGIEGAIAAREVLTTKGLWEFPVGDEYIVDNLVATEGHVIALVYPRQTRDTIGYEWPEGYLLQLDAENGEQVRRIRLDGGTDADSLLSGPNPRESAPSSYAGHHCSECAVVVYGRFKQIGLKILSESARLTADGSKLIVQDNFGADVYFGLLHKHLWTFDGIGYLVALSGNTAYFAGEEGMTVVDLEDGSTLFRWLGPDDEDSESAPFGLVAPTASSLVVQVGNELIGLR